MYDLKYISSTNIYKKLEIYVFNFILSNDIGLHFIDNVLHLNINIHTEEIT